MGYLTEDELKMDRESVNLQIVLGLQSCSSKGEVMELLNEIRKHERLQLSKEGVTDVR